VAHGIGGVSFVTLIVLPLARSRGSIELFDDVERRFAAQGRISYRWLARRAVDDLVPEPADRCADWHGWWIAPWPARMEA